MGFTKINMMHPTNFCCDYRTYCAIDDFKAGILKEIFSQKGRLKNLLFYLRCVLTKKEKSQNQKILGRGLGIVYKVGGVILRLVHLFLDRPKGYKG